MSPGLRLLAAVAALVAGCAPLTAAQPLTPVIRWADPPQEPAASETAPPQVRVSIPRYALTDSERETIAACLVLEAASQGEFGMRAVMAVIRNRARGMPELFASTVLRPKQFSALNRLTAGRESLTGVIARAQRDRMWGTALAVVDAATHDAWHDPTEGATHYTRTGERTPWTRRLAPTVRIGAHSFYR